MSLHTVSVGGTVNAADINQFTNVLQQPSGGTESGGYYLTFNGSSGASGGTWISSLTRGATPVSASVDTSVTSPTQCNAPTVNNLTANGFHVFSATTGTVLAANVGGLYTINF